MPGPARISDRKPRLSKHLEIRDLADGTRLVKQTHSAAYLALSRDQQRILQRFAGGARVHDALLAELTSATDTDIRGFYDLVVFALENGFLEDMDQPAPPVEGRTPAEWPVGWGAHPAFVLALVAATVGAVSILQNEPRLPGSPLGWAFALLVVSVSFSLSAVLAGCVLNGMGRCVYGAGPTFSYAVPHFGIDPRDAFMAGRRGEQAVALQDLAVPFLLMGIFGQLSWEPGYFGAVLAALVTACPFGRTPAHRFLHATFRKSYQLPHCAATFLGKKLLRHLFGRLSTDEDDYLTVYGAYCVFWLGALILFVGGLVHRQGVEFTEKFLFAPDPATRLGAFLVLLLLAILILTPIAWQLWFLAHNAYNLLAPYWFKAESRVRKSRVTGESAPTTEEVVGFLKETMLFAPLAPETLERIARAMEFLQVAAGTPIIREGDQGDSLFVVCVGQVDVLKDDATGTPRVVATLGPGDAFGEIALLSRTQRTASVVSTRPTSLLVLDRTSFETILVGTLGAERITSILQVCAFLRRNRMFRNWDDKALQHLAASMEFAEFDSGDDIIRQGVLNDSFYVVYEGTVRIRKDKREVARLRAGEFFGEVSLLKGIPAVADATADGHVRCLKLDRDEFLALVSHDLHTGMAIGDAVEERLGGSRDDA